MRKQAPDNHDGPLRPALETSKRGEDMAISTWHTAANGLVYVVLVLLLLGGCSSTPKDGDGAATQGLPEPSYTIGPGDELQVFVWNNPDLSGSVPVRPDGRITTPLVEDVRASGKTPTQLAREIEQRLARYVKNPVVTVTVTSFVGSEKEQIRVIGQAAEPQSIPYRENITVLDVMIAVGGLTEFASGNRATIIRPVGGEQRSYRVRLDDLVNDGDITANVKMYPGDILIIPEAWF
jgi:polysaccharide export outer membrane protein